MVKEVNFLTYLAQGNYIQVMYQMQEMNSTCLKSFDTVLLTTDLSFDQNRNNIHFYDIYHAQKK